MSRLGSRLREELRKSRTLRRLVRWCRSRGASDPGWSRILGPEEAAWRCAREEAAGPRVLVATMLGGYWAGTTLESLLSVALTMRGARVEVLLCDGALPACQACEVRNVSAIERFARSGPREDLCGPCFEHGRAVYEGLGLPVVRLGTLLAREDLEAASCLARETDLGRVAEASLDGLRVGEHALAGALRFFARGDLRGEPQGEAVLRRYLEAAALTARAAQRLLRDRPYDVALFHHGIYVPQGILGEAARAQGVRVVNWNPSYRKGTFIFSHGDSYHHTLLDEPASAWEDLELGDAQEAALSRYLKSRWQGTEDWIWFHREPEEDFSRLARSIGLDPGKPFVGLLTNVIWDAQLHFRARVFPDQMAWIRATVERFLARPDLQLVLRIHPAEIRGTVPSRQRVADELRRLHPSLPPHIIVVPPEHPASTYALLERADAALIYGTKMGVELAAMGKRVIVAGEAWARGKGFTLDAESPEGYGRLLDALPAREAMSVEQVRRARRYAYHFFFRRMIPLDCMEATGADPPFKIRLAGLSALTPGASAGLDVVLDGVLHGAPFVYPAERLDARAPARVGASLLARG